MFIFVLDDRLVWLQQVDQMTPVIFLFTNVCCKTKKKNLMWNISLEMHQPTLWLLISLA